jgi:hypothetical protein
MKMENQDFQDSEEITIQRDEERNLSSLSNIATRLVNTDWSLLNGLVIGFVMEILVFFLVPYSLKTYVPFAGGLVSGLIARENGWIAGTILGLVSFAIMAYAAFYIEQKFGARFRADPNMAHMPLSYNIGQAMALVPLGAAGGFVGGFLRSLVQKYAKD